ncbi:hypothetical protein KSS87_022853 [Heliosperma pusillum]|nr:hypothetical protein KSS87_022853 [Heliosperma pusillum]
MSSSCVTSISKLKSMSSVFDDGDYPTVLLKIDPKKPCCADKTTSHPPTPLLIATPSKRGHFPVLLLIHGYLLYNDFYSQLIQHIASHGFIVIAPQVAFALALQKLTTSPHQISALIGIDPVDGMDKGKQTPPHVLSYVPQSFNLSGMPTLVIGSGYGETKKNAFFPACAPKGVNHENFYDECQNPAWYFVVENQGHLDMLDDETKGVRGKSTHCLCKNGRCREPMRRFVGGVIVAFLNAYLQGCDTQLLLIKDGDDTSPVSFSKVDHRC